MPIELSDRIESPDHSWVKEQLEENFGDELVDLKKNTVIGVLEKVCNEILPNNGNNLATAFDNADISGASFTLALQIALKAINDADNTANCDPGELDGIYGRNTRTAVENFQKYRKISVDGAAGQGTLEDIMFMLTFPNKVTTIVEEDDNVQGNNNSNSQNNNSQNNNSQNNNSQNNNSQNNNSQNNNSQNNNSQNNNQNTNTTPVDLSNYYLPPDMLSMQIPKWQEQK